MIRLILVADSGGPMAALTESLAAIASVEIVRHASSRAQLGPIVRRLAPDVVIIDEIHRPRLVLSHVEALTAQAPQVGIVVLTTRPDAGWLADALRAGAAAVAPAGLGPAMLERVLGEVVAGPSPLPTRLAA